MLLDMPHEAPDDPSDKQLSPVNTTAVCKTLARFEDEGDGESLHNWMGVIFELGFYTCSIGAYERVIGQAAGMQQQVAERDLLGWRLQGKGLAANTVRHQGKAFKLREVLVHGLVESDGAALDELQGGDVGDELPG